MRVPKNFRSRVHVGRFGEDVARLQCRACGWLVAASDKSDFRLLDCVYESASFRAAFSDYDGKPGFKQVVRASYEVEVKTARRAVDGRYHFTLYKRGSQQFYDAHLIILVFLPSLKMAVIPTSDISPDTHQICISSEPGTYAGKWSRFILADANDFGRRICEGVENVYSR